MPNNSYMPSRQAEQVAWSANFFEVLSAGPPIYGPTEAQTTAFGLVNTALQTAWTQGTMPSTKTKLTVAGKDIALANMKIMARDLVSIIQGTDTVTDVQKLALGLTVRDKTPTRIPAPTTKPFIKVLGIADRTVTIQLQQAEEDHGRPAGVTGATIFTYTGTAAPTSQEAWKFAANVTRTRVELPFPPSATTDTVWITAFWKNAKNESGPSAVAASVMLYPGGFLPTEMTEAA